MERMERIRGEGKGVWDGRGEGSMESGYLRNSIMEAEMWYQAAYDAYVSSPLAPPTPLLHPPLSS